MKITSSRVRIYPKDTNLKAIASITLDEELVIKDIKIVQSKNEIFVSMPSRRLRDGEFQDICFPITAEFRKNIQNEVIDCYEKEIA